MIKGTTASGFAFALPESVTNNMELVDAIARLQEGGQDSVCALSKTCLLMLGKEQRRRLYDHLRTPEGCVPADAVMQALLEMLNACGKPGKNSASSPD